MTFRPLPPPVSVSTSATTGVGRDDFVSGEAVALDLPPAGVGLRILSGLIDVVVDVAVYIGLVFLLLQVFISNHFFDNTSVAMLLSLHTCVIIASLVGIPTVCETLTRGKTLGHLVVGLRTVRDDAGPITFRQALTRAMLGFVEIYSCGGLPALLCSAVSRKGKRFGDLLAGTYVVRDRFSLNLPQPAPMPPELAGWASTADLAPLPVPLTIAARSFFARADTMTPPARAQLGGQLAGQMARFVAPPPPAAAPPEMVIAAILAERRTRDAARIARDQRLRERVAG
ncbi:RDD family protein [Gordonia sp. TBRC 11910]|uniref:RDD family protein n=1 Tax=Gordonia asplenii TaxID=2725283 RepID=A0A848KZ54_9ACTN|nr:RDD family protein [Gordonia asplenii]NMO03437.1 RDD family protein [Gordonia asplenii]